MKITRLPKRLRGLSWSDLQAMHHDDVCLVVRHALERNGWAQAPAAVSLGMTRRVLQGVVASSPLLQRLIAVHGPGPGGAHRRRR